jgi:hypothetical protein
MVVHVIVALTDAVKTRITTRLENDFGKVSMVDLAEFPRYGLIQSGDIAGISPARSICKCLQLVDRNKVALKCRYQAFAEAYAVYSFLYVSMSAIAIYRQLS